MKEKDNVLFFDTSALEETQGIRDRANAAYLSEQLQARFPEDSIQISSLMINESGKYSKPIHSIQGLPPYCAVKVEHKIGQHMERITVWTPLAWNERFFGTGGGGTETGGDFYIKRSDNTSRGMTLPMAIINGFTAATTDAGNTKPQWAFDGKPRKLDRERIENWRARSTHFMTLVGKAVAEILHQRLVRYSYFHGGSGGGRQAMVEAQVFPHDYNGIWASCPAINWTKFFMTGLWPIALMNTHRHCLTLAKIRYFLKAAQDSVGGQDAYYNREDKVDFDPFSVVGQRIKGGIITEADAAIMKGIWDGPRSESGKRLWYGFRPGVLFWNHIIPVGAFYYPLFGKRPKPFVLVERYLRWITEDPKQRFDKVSMADFYALFDQSVSKMKDIAADGVDLSAYVEAGGKLIIDHGIDDPLIPVDGTVNYFDRLCTEMTRDVVRGFCRLYITPGDGHGTCNWHGPGITERDGAIALMRWVEDASPPEAIRVVQVDKTGTTICEKTRNPYKLK